jgi:DNA topoisomerase-2
MSKESQTLMSETKMGSEYKRLSHRDHILELPDTYIGSVETHEEHRWVYDNQNKKMAYKKVNFNPGFYKLFDEIIVNSRDALIRSQTEKDKTPVKHISVSVNQSEGKPFTIIVENDGDGIPVVHHAEYNVWVPELIFGHLLTSGNYNKEEEKIVGGKNGYGAKLANIFSTSFTVETRDTKTGTKYSQTWTDHMSTCSKASITKDKAKGFVRITFVPDLTRFVGLDLDEMNQVLHTRAIELAALAGKDVKVSWNGEVISTNTFEKFTHLFVRDEASIAYEKCSDRWEIAAVLTRSLFEDDDTHDERHVSFANGVNTKKGGKHVETVAKHVLGDFCEVAKKKKVDVKPSQLKDSVLFFVNATIVNPSFDSQTKECLTTPANKFGSQFKCSSKFADTLVKMGLLEEAQNILDAKMMKEAKKTDGAKKKTIRGLPKLEDALWAGTAKSSECTLILTEGDSAATSAISGLKIVGRETWGVFPLKGKMLNVKDISQIKFNQNEELTAIKKILGLEQGKKYSSVKDLRYGRVMVMADQDLDGAHIKGLLMNLFHTEWPSLMKIGFICSLATPLLKATKRNETKSFYSQAEYDAWLTSQGDDIKGWKLKYYKGLGTSTPAEAREWFQHLHEIKYKWDDATDESVSLAFSKKRSDDRKTWLSTYDAKRMAIPDSAGNLGFSRFIHDELIHFSNADNLRSLPHLMDGLKPSQRKILFGCLKRGLKQEIRVAQLAGYVSEHAAYHHGEASLNSTIVGMAQTFVGSNNINLLVPIGQFGSRLLGGKDSASPRYIHTHLEPIVESLFRKEDNAILDYQEDDGLAVEPETYLPVVPLLAINGCVGIGTGFSTDIPPHHPMTIVTMLRDRLEGRRATLEGLTVQPWWFGFKGPIVPSGDAWITKGLYTMDDTKKTVTITELPVGTWTKDYKVFLDTLAGGEGQAALGENGKPILKSFDDLYDDDTVNFVLYLDADYYEDVKADMNDFEKRFKLTTSWRLSNMTCFNNEMQIEKYSCIGDMVEAFYEPRLEAYEKRRQNEMARLEREALEADAKARFLRAVLDGDIELRRATDEEIVSAMMLHELPPLSDESNPESVDAYDYLLRLRMDRVKASAIEDAEKAVIAARMAYEELRDTTASALWLEDLNDFETAWCLMEGNRAHSSSTSGAPKKRRTVKK